MLLRFPCGGIVRCNGRLDSGQREGSPRPIRFSSSGFLSHPICHQRIDLNEFRLPKVAIVCPTLCRSAASPPHERFADVTPISLRRDRPLQRPVRRRPASQGNSPARFSAFGFPWPTYGRRESAHNRFRNPKWRSSVERFAVQRRARRTNGSLMLLRFPCGGIVRCNGRLDSGQRAGSPRPIRLSSFGFLRHPICHQRIDHQETRLPKWRSSVQRYAVKRWAAVCGRPSASTAC